LASWVGLIRAGKKALCRQFGRPVLALWAHCLGFQLSYPPLLAGYLESDLFQLLLQFRYPLLYSDKGACSSSLFPSASLLAEGVGRRNSGRFRTRSWAHAHAEHIN
jgi:hypothetical protein